MRYYPLLLNLKNKPCLVIGSERAINTKISQEARKSAILINAVDAEDLSDFIVPSSISKGGLILSLSTSGRAPGLSKRMRRDIERLLVPEYARSLKILKGLRRELKEKCSDPGLRRLGQMTLFRRHCEPRRGEAILFVVEIASSLRFSQ